MTTSKGRIAQTFPDINSSTGTTVATSAGVRSFPEPFIAIPSGVDIQIQNRAATVPIGSLGFTDVLPIPVDITKSFIIYRGVNQDASSIFHTVWRTRMSFTGIVGSVASSVIITRRLTGVSAITAYYTVVTFLGSGTTSADIRIENVFGSITHPVVGLTVAVPLPKLTAAELARATVFVRGLEFKRIPGGAAACSAGTGIDCSKIIEQAHGDVEMVNTAGPNTTINYTRFSSGGGGPDNCGTSTVDVYFTVVVWP